MKLKRINQNSLLASNEKKFTERHYNYMEVSKWIEEVKMLQKRFKSKDEEVVDKTDDDIQPL